MQGSALCIDRGFFYLPFFWRRSCNNLSSWREISAGILVNEQPYSRNNAAQLKLEDGVPWDITIRGLSVKYLAAEW
jgi:hypothetical protein